MKVIDLQLFAGEKTETATPRKREEARKKGQVAKSGEIGTAALILAGFYTLSLLGATSINRLGSLMRHLLSSAFEFDGTPEAAYALLLVVLREAALLLLPIFGVLLLISLMSQGFQVGLMLTWETLTPKFSRVNPLEGFKRIFSKRALVEFAKSLFKISIIGYLAYRQVANSLPWLPGLMHMELIDGLELIANNIIALAGWIGIALLIIAVSDYLYQRWEFEQSIKMTKQEVKDEYKQTEGDPQIRSKIRQKQRQMAQQRMMEAVPQADVVITNPTHYAIAIKYEMGEMSAPLVVAKGVGEVALRIKNLAKENRIPTVENPTLARTLYSTTEIGQEIPPDLYPAVAEVLAFVYRLRKGNRKTS